MATESVSDPIREPGPAAMNFDSGTYLAWIQSIGEVMMNVRMDGDIPGCAARNYGGLILALAEAAEELQESERNLRSKVSAAPATAGAGGTEQ